MLILVLVARRESLLQQLAEKLKKRYQIEATVVACDLSAAQSADMIYRSTEDLGIKVDILINNAGYADVGDFFKVSWSEHEQLLQTMLLSLTKLCYLYVPSMLKRKSGSIINVASVLGLVNFSVSGRAMRILYGPIKSFVVSFSKRLSFCYRDGGVYCQGLCPGLTHSEFHLRCGEEKRFQKIPKWFWCSSEKVVTKSLRHVERRRKAVLVTGWPNYLFIFMYRIRTLFGG